MDTYEMDEDWKEKLRYNLKGELSQRTNIEWDIFVKNSYWLGFDIYSSEFRSYVLSLVEDGYITLDLKHFGKGDKFDEL